MLPTRPLYVHEELLLLSLRDEEGTLHSGAWMQQALAGGILAELLTNGRVRIERVGEQDVLSIASNRALGDPLLDDCLASIRESSKRQPIQHWAALFAIRGDLMPKTAEGLSRLGVLRTDEKKVLLIFTRKIYPEIDPRPEAALIEKLRLAIFSDQAEVDPHTATLVAIANQTGLLRANFDHEKLKAQQSRIKRIAKGDFAGDATQSALQSQHTAFFLMSMMPLLSMPGR